MKRLKPISRWLVIATLVNCFFLMACDDSSSNPSSDECEGCYPYGKIYWEYEFSDFEKLTEFYEIFKQSNEERYLFPISDSSLQIKYCFSLVGYAQDYGRYDIEIESYNQYAYVTFVFEDGFSFELQLFDISKYSLDNPFFSCEIEDYSNNRDYSYNYYFFLYCNQQVIGQIETKKYASIEPASTYLPSYYYLFMEGLKYAL